MISVGLLTSLAISGCMQNAAKPDNAMMNEKRNPQCRVNENIQRNAIPQTPQNMSLPSFGQGVIGWATGPDGAKARLENVQKQDILSFKEKGASFEMIKEWQAFYENEINRNPCNPTAVYRAKLMKKIADLWVE